MRQRPELSGVVSDHLLERPVAADEAGAAIGHDYADGRLVEHRAEQRFALVQRLRRAFPLDDAAELRADVPQHVEQGRVGRDGIGGEELEHGGHLGADGHGERQPGAEPRLRRRIAPREVGVLRHVDDPRRLPGGEDATRQADAASQRGLLRRAAERIVAWRSVVVPDPGRSQQVGVVRGHFVDVPYWPPAHAAHLGDRRLERMLGGLRLVGGDGDILQQLDERDLLLQGSLGRATLGHHRRQHEPGHRHQAEKGLQQGEVLGRRGGDEGSEPVQRVPDRQGRDDGRRRRRAAAPEPQRGPYDHREDRVHVGERIAEQQRRQEQQRGEQAGGFEPPPGGAPGADPREQEGCDEHVSQRVARPPHEPETPQRVRRDGPVRPQARDPDRGAERRARECADHDEGDHVAHPLERGSEGQHPPQQPGARDGFERVPQRDPRSAWRGHPGRPVEEEGRQRDARPEA